MRHNPHATNKQRRLGNGGLLNLSKLVGGEINGEM
jgi:hypothetical protein